MPVTSTAKWLGEDSLSITGKWHAKGVSPEASKHMACNSEALYVTLEAEGAFEPLLQAANELIRATKVKENGSGFFHIM
ncbi:MAG: hypothetical protein GY942_16250 [Aestuariibacter sp.]|nr:hypothetical protein [Aestuariibacter sp.]